MRHSDANNMPSTPYYMRHFQIFDKIDSFLKDVSNVLDIFEKPLNLHIIVDKLFSPSVLDSRRTFCSIFHCRNSFNCKLEKLMNEQIIIYYSPSNALCLSDKSMQKNRRHTLFGICSLSSWFNLQILNFRSSHQRCSI